MANKPTTDLPALSSSELAGATLYVVDADGNSRKVTFEDLKTAINTDPTVVPASEPLVGAAVQLSASFAVASTSEQIVSWGASDYDSDSFWSGGAPTRLTVPSGVTKVRLSAGVRSTAGGSIFINLAIRKNGSTYVVALACDTGFANSGHNVTTGILEVTAGDYFEVSYTQSGAGSRTVVDDPRTYFSIEAVEHTL